MRTIDFDLAELDSADLTSAIERFRAFTRWTTKRDARGAANVGASVVDSLEAERSARDAGRGNGSVRLTAEDFADEDPTDAMAWRREAVGMICAVIRDDDENRDAVRRLGAAIAADLSNPSEIAQAVELARLERLS